MVGGFAHSSISKESACNAGDLDSIPGSGRSPGERNGNPLQYSCPENPIDRGDWQTTVHGVARVGHDLVTKPQPPWWLSVRASIPRQVDKKSKGPRGGGERGLGLSRRRKGSGILKEEERTNIFFLHSLVRIITM